MTMYRNQKNMVCMNLHFFPLTLAVDGSFDFGFEPNQVLFERRNELEASPEPPEPLECVFALVLGIILTKTGARLKETA